MSKRKNPDWEVPLSPEIAALKGGGGTATLVLIGFTGAMGAGKDEAGVALRRLGFKRFAFADALKDMLEVGLGLNHPQLHGSQREKNTPIDWLDGKTTPRHLMQTLGTSWGRDTIARDLWIRVLERRLNQSEDLAVVTDVRFENEAKMIRSAGGVIIHIERPPLSGKKPWWKRLSWPKRVHPSEVKPKVLAGDFVVQNTGTVADLHRAVTAIVQKPL